MDDEDRYTRITLRIPKDLHRSLSVAADATSKSLNAEIIARLQQSFTPEGAVSGSEMTALLAEFGQMLDQKLRRYGVIDDAQGMRVVRKDDGAADGDDDELRRLEKILARDDGVTPLPELKLEPTSTKGLPGRGKAR